jgi:putative oxidoreductase
MHIPAPLAFLAIAAESLGALALILGFLTRFAALGLAANMAVAIATVHYKNGLFMNWYGQQKGEGFEYHILAGGIALALVITGAGKLSIDSLLAGGGGSRSPK